MPLIADIVPEAAIDYIKPSYVVWKMVSMQGPAIKPHKPSDKFVSHSKALRPPSRTSLKSCGERKSSLLGEGVLGDGITEQEELFMYSGLRTVSDLSYGTKTRDQPLTMLNGVSDTV